MKYRTLLLAVALSMPAAAFASDTAINVVEPFVAQRAQIEADLSDGKTYNEIAPADRRKVHESLERMTGLLGAATDASTLDESTRIALFNEQEVVNTILTQAREDSRVVCRRNAPVGTRFAKAQCESVAESRRRREASQEQFRQTPQVPRLSPP
jgi:hypothetical protein